MSASKTKLTLYINGHKVSREVSPDYSLADFLQEDLGLSGTKVCCGMGICKACTVAAELPGDARLTRVQACVTPATSLAGAKLTTVEGLSRGDRLHPLQEAFLRHFSFQCGYSSSGFLMGAVLLMDQLKREPVPRSQVDTAIADSLGSHVCRCTGYVKYYAAIKEVILKTPGLTQEQS